MLARPIIQRKRDSFAVYRILFRIRSLGCQFWRLSHRFSSSSPRKYNLPPTPHPPKKKTHTHTKKQTNKQTNKQTPNLALTSAWISFSPAYRMFTTVKTTYTEHQVALYWIYHCLILWRHCAPFYNQSPYRNFLACIINILHSDYMKLGCLLTTQVIS